MTARETVTSRPRYLLLLLLPALAAAAGCASAGLPPPADAAARAAATQSYSGRMRVSLRAPTLRARAPVLVAFSRPDALRIEVPGPGGARLVAVTRGGKLTAVFPAERAVFQGQATAVELEALLGVALTPAEVIDLLLGVPSPRLRSYQTRWGVDLPRRIEATLPDGARLRLDVEEADRGVELPPSAFDDPPHVGYRAIAVDEARTLWTR
jgi:outer membrane lipoprotein-sorting protein